MSVNFNKELTLKRAENYLKQNQVNSAIEEYKKILEVTKDINTMNLLGDLYIRVGDNERAIGCFIPVAEEYCTTGFLVKAIAMYKKIHKFDISNKEILLKIADLYIKNKHPMEARHFYNQVLEDYKKEGNRQEVIKILKLIIDLEPENISKRLELALNYQEENLLLETEATYEEIGQELLRQGKITQAIEILEKILSQNPLNKNAIRTLVDTLVLDRQTDKALQIIKKAIAKNPEDIELFVILGKTYLVINKLDEAERTFIDLLIKDKTRYGYLLEIAKVFLAEKEFDRVVSLIELFMDVVLEKKQKRRITALLKEILKQDPNHLKTIKCLAYIYKKLEEKDNLIATLKMLVKTALSHNEELEAIGALNSLIELESDNTVYKKELEIIKSSSSGDIAKESTNLQPNKSSTSLLQANKGATNLLPSTAINLKTSTKSLKLEKEINPYSTHELLEGMMSGNSSYLDAQESLLEAMIVSYPDYLEARIKLKGLYLQKDLKQKAAQQCLEIAEIYKAQNEEGKAKKILLEAYNYDPSLEELADITLQETVKTEKLVDKSEEISIELDLNSQIDLTDIFVSQEVVSSASTVDSLKVDYKELDLSSMFSGQEPKISKQKATALKLNDNSSSPLSFSDLAFLVEKNAILDREWRRAIRSNEEVSLVAIRIDDFTTYLFLHGEAFVKNCISEVSKTVEDLLNRGGDQLVTFNRKDILLLVLPDTPKEGALLIVQKIKSSISNIKFTQIDYLTVSQVIATEKPKRNNKPSLLLEKLVDNYSKLTTKDQIL